MFVEIKRVNEDNELKELVVDTNEIAFLSETTPHVCEDKPTEFEEETDLETGEVVKTPVEWEVEERFLVAFKNGKHPQFLNRENYEKLKSVLLK